MAIGLAAGRADGPTVGLAVGLAGGGVGGRDISGMSVAFFVGSLVGWR